MIYRFFDFEVTPNWWLCVFGDLPEGMTKENITDEIKSDFDYVSSDMINARDLLIDKMKNSDVCLLGYNIKGYDLIIANGIYQGFGPHEIKLINDLIINPSLQYTSKEYMAMGPFSKKRISGCIYQDLYDSSDGTLKEKEATLGLSVLESAVDFNKENLTSDDKEDMIYYCKHDVYASMIWYLEIVQPFVYSKLMVGKAFDIPLKDVYCSTNAQLVAKALSAHRTEFNDSENKTITLNKKINGYCYENLPTPIVDYVTHNTESFEVKLFENNVVFADGGLHSIYDTRPSTKGKPDILYVEANDEWRLMNVDAASYYPSIMIFLNTLSRSIKDAERFKFVYDDRIRIKHKKDKTKEDDDLQLAYKLILNTTYGASGCEFLDLCDKYQRTRTCRFGQLFLAALANKLYHKVPNLKVIQTNTDGILIYYMRKYDDIVTQCMKEWTDISGIGMDGDDCEKIWQRDVNNYLLIKKGGKIKRKGAWLCDDYIKPGYIKISPLTAYVCGKAAIQWLVNGIDPIKTILSNNNISDFAITCKKGPSFRGVIQRYSDGTEKQLYKCNRVLATKDETQGMIYKYKMVKGTLSYYKMPDIPEHCLLINDDLKTYNFSEIKKELDYMFYIERVANLLDYTFKQLDGNNLEIINKYDLDY